MKMRHLLAIVLTLAELPLLAPFLVGALLTGVLRGGGLALARAARLLGAHRHRRALGAEAARHPRPALGS